MVRLKDEGKVRFIGVSNFTAAHMEKVRHLGPITSLQPPYSIISPEVEAAHLPYCQEHGIGVIVYSPMKSGLLTGKMTHERVAAMPDDDFRKRALNYQEPRLSRNLLVAEKVREIGARHGRSPGRSGDRVVPQKSGGDRGHRRRQKCFSSGGRRRRQHLPAGRQRDRRDRPIHGRSPGLRRCQPAPQNR